MEIAVTRDDDAVFDLRLVHSSLKASSPSQENAEETLCPINIGARPRTCADCIVSNVPVSPQSSYAATPLIAATTPEPGVDPHATVAMRRLTGHASRTDGGYDVAHDPDIPVGFATVAWLPELSPSTLILESAPDGFDQLVAVDPACLKAAPGYPAADDGQKLMDFDGANEVYVLLRDNRAVGRPAVLVPIDASFELRAEVALRFVRRLRGDAVARLPAALRLTPAKKQRLVRLLHAFDVLEAGGGPRDVAAIVLRSKQAKLPAVEWKDSHTRRAASRLIHESIILVDRDYLKLLRGG